MIQLILGLAVIGFLLYLLLTYVPMAQPFKQLIVVVVVLCIVLYLLSVFGILDIPIPRTHR